MLSNTSLLNSVHGKRDKKKKSKLEVVSLWKNLWGTSAKTGKIWIDYQTTTDYVKAYANNTMLQNTIN